MVKELDLEPDARRASKEPHAGPSAAMPAAPTLRAVIESPAEAPSFVAVLPARPWPSHVRLWAETPDTQVALVVAQLAQYGHGGDAAEDLAALVNAFPEIVPGGIAAGDELQEVFPSCCCGLETWREWQKVATDGTGPWLGHDPSPWVEAREDAILVWPDGGLGEASEADQHPVRFSRPQFDTALVEVEGDLRDFQIRLKAWAASVSPELATGLADRFGALVRLDATSLPLDP
jgi:hypothetical protein